MVDTINWLSYKFTVYLKQSQWDNVAGIYIFAGLNPDRTLWMPYYTGQCDNFLNRIPSHEQWDKAQRLGATHVHAMTVQLEADRDSIEKELIRYFQPPLNVQLRR
jgi:hypothetical protein